MFLKMNSKLKLTDKIIYNFSMNFNGISVFVTANPAGYENRFAVSTTRVLSTPNEWQCNVRVIQSINRADVTSLDVVILVSYVEYCCKNRKYIIELNLFARLKDNFNKSSDYD